MINSKKIIKYFIWGITSVLLLFGVAVIFITLVLEPNPNLALEKSGERTKVNSAITINFLWPVDREAEIEIFPEVFGSITYENKVIKDHLVRTIKFTPELNWWPNTQYTLTLSNVKSALPTLNKAKTYSFTFLTEKSPEVASISPDSEEEILADTFFVINLDKANNNLSKYSFSLSPAIDFVTQLSEDKKSYTLIPDKSLSQGSEYDLKVIKKDIRLYFGSDEVAFQDSEEKTWQKKFTVRKAPYIDSFSPEGINVELTEKIKIIFSEEIKTNSFLEKITINPDITGQWQAEDSKTYIFTPEQEMTKDTSYTVSLTEGVKSLAGGYFEEAATYSFSTKGPVKMVSSSPLAGDTGISIDSPIRIDFNGTVDHASAESKFSISPSKEGNFSWEGNTLIFRPSTPFDFNQTYTVSLEPGISCPNRYSSECEYSFSFSTELSVTRLNVTFHRQEHSLSCEVATLVMALSYRGLNISEAELINFIGFDPTPKANGVWGNPHIAFVGDIDGHQPSTGYGVYWQPIASAGNQYRPTGWFTDGNLEMITGEIKKGNPVIIWGTAGTGRRIDWLTAEGGNVVAITGEHTMIVTGFMGSASNPTKIIVLDPLFGEKSFTQNSFLWNWRLLNRSGVIVE